MTRSKERRIAADKFTADKRYFIERGRWLDGAIWQKLQLIGKAIAWLSEHNKRDFTDFDGLGGAVFHTNRMLNAFRRAMMKDDESYATGKIGSYTTSTK